MYSNKQQMRKKVRGGFLPLLAGPMMGMMGNPMEMFQKSNPLSMLMGRGVVHPQTRYYGSGGVVHPQYQYNGSGMSGGNFLDFFNPVKSPMAPWNWGGGQVGGKKRRGTSARGQKIAHLMKTRGLTLGQASAYLKNNGQ